MVTLNFKFYQFLDVRNIDYINSEKSKVIKRESIFQENIF